MVVCLWYWTSPDAEREAALVAHLLFLRGTLT